MLPPVSISSPHYRKVPAIDKVHFVGVCGVAMGTLAGMMKELGYRVTGSDEHVYPPMSDMLRGWGIEVRPGFAAGNVDGADLVIVGNAISRGNAEAEEVLNRRVPYMSMAQALQAFFLNQREVISVSGTHGKTTTTALLAHILDVAGEDPSFLVGGVARNYDSNYRMGRGRHFVIEGDEYDSAFFEKVPKFILYRPRHCLLTSLEFDHADIYANLDEIKLWFRRLVNIVPSEGEIVYSAEYPVLGEVTTNSLSRLHSYGPGGDFACEPIGFTDAHTKLRFGMPDGEVELITPLIGAYNYANICGAAAMARRLGVTCGAIAEAVRTFTGVKRRQELIYEQPGVRIYEDFAHHPTAISYFISAMRERFPGAKILAVYEPRSATSRRNVFQESLPGSFGEADRVFIKRPYRLEGIRESERIDIGTVIDGIHALGKQAALYDSVDDIVRDVIDGMQPSGQNIVLIMSNGGFDGIYAKMIDAVKATRPA